MTFRTHLLPALAAAFLSFAGVTSASAQALQTTPPSTNTQTTQPLVVTRVHGHNVVHHHTTKTTSTTRSTSPRFRGPLHTKKVAPLASNVPLVWVNIPTGVYHYPGSASYGKTENGTYMTEADALKQHYRAAFNNQ